MWAQGLGTPNKITKLKEETKWDILEIKMPPDTSLVKIFWSLRQKNVNQISCSKW